MQRKEKRKEEMKSNIKKMIEAVKKNKTLPDTTMTDALTKALVHPAFRVRDMKKEAIDMGAHGAKEYFGGGTV